MSIQSWAALVQKVGLGRLTTTSFCGGYKVRSGSVRLGADVGGTFTDIAVFDHESGLLNLGKTLTTPQQLVEGIDNGVRKAGSRFSAASLFLHGTTVAINTILERTGAKTGLLITRGFRDIYEIGRVNRPEAYNLYFRRHRPLVDRNLRREIHERLSADGEVLQPLNDEEVVKTARELVDAGCEAIAILFLHSYANPEHERKAKQLVQDTFPDLFVTASHELSQEYREFERVSTTAANAYVGPQVRKYLRGMRSHLERARFDGTFLIVQSSGGLFDDERAQNECIRMLESGPASGVIGAHALCTRVGLQKAIAFDMGGTTAKAAVIDNGHVLMTSSSMVGGYTEGLPVQVPMIDIQEVGTGGGSIARVGLANSLRVGPESAGAAPGPVCYRLGGSEPTVTDANVVLGRIGSDRFLGGEMPLDAEGARRSLKEKIADPLKLEPTAAAEGILRVAVLKMSQVVRWVTTERGLDASDFTLIAYGGAGPLHASLLARELRMSSVIIPRAPGHFSAVGMLMSDLRSDSVRTWFRSLAEASFDQMETIYGEMEREGRAALQKAKIDLQEVSVVRSADLRYVGQEHAVTVELPLKYFADRDRSAIKQHFDAVHAKRYGYANEKEEAEVVSLRTAVAGHLSKPPFEEIRSGSAAAAKEAFRGNRQVFFKGLGFFQTPTYERSHLRAGNRLEGPALIEEYASTTVVHPGDVLEVDSFGNLVLQIARD